MRLGRTGPDPTSIPGLLGTIAASNQAILEQLAELNSKLDRLLPAPAETAADPDPAFLAVQDSIRAHYRPPQG